MKKIVLMLVSLFACHTALAAPTIYVGLQSGISYQDAKGIKGSYIPAGMNNVDATISDNAFALYFGYDFNQSEANLPLRIEASYTTRGSVTQRFNKGTIINKDTIIKGSGAITTGLDTLMANIYYDFHNNSSFTPYIMAGVGLAVPFSVHDATEEYSAEDQAVKRGYHDFKVLALGSAWNLGGGVSFSLTPNFKIDLLAKYTIVGSTKRQVTSSYVTTIQEYSISSIKAIDGMLGITYVF